MADLKTYKLNWTLNKVTDNSDPKDQIIYDLLAESANDLNSSKFREDVTKWLIGLEASEGKHGYDDDTLAIEVKPKNFTGKQKLNGGGQFTDFTWARHRKYLADDVKIVVSGFDKGRILFVVQFDYSVIAPKIESKLVAQLPNGDQPNRYVRSATFSYMDWKDSKFEVRFISPEIGDHSGAITPRLFKLIT
jgi:hypothetical protein